LRKYAQVLRCRFLPALLIIEHSKKALPKRKGPVIPECMAINIDGVAIAPRLFGSQGHG